MKINLVFRALPHIFSFLSSAFLRFTWEYLVNLMALLNLRHIFTLTTLPFGRGPLFQRASAGWQQP